MLLPFEWVGAEGGVVDEEEEEEVAEAEGGEELGGAILPDLATMSICCL
jgi:hypothetical protein